jgi:hypothetical protein
MKCSSNSDCRSCPCSMRSTAPRNSRRLSFIDFCYGNHPSLAGGGSSSEIVAVLRSLRSKDAALRFLPVVVGKKFVILYSVNNLVLWQINGCHQKCLMA